MANKKTIKITSSGKVSVLKVKLPGMLNFLAFWQQHQERNADKLMMLYLIDKWKQIGERVTLRPHEFEYLALFIEEYAEPDDKIQWGANLMDDIEKIRTSITPLGTTIQYSPSIPI